MKLSLIIPVKDDPRLMTLLERLVFATEEFELIVACNGSTDAFIELVETHVCNRKHARVLRVPGIGSPHAINYAAQHALGEFLIVLDSDCAIGPTYLAAMLIEGTRHPIARGHIRFTGRTLFARSTAIWRQAINARVEREGRIHTPNLLIRRDIFLAVGGFNQNLRYAYDSDLSERLLRQGWRAVIVDGAEVEHECHTRIGNEMKIWYCYGIGRFHRMHRHWQHKNLGQRIVGVFLDDLPWEVVASNWCMPLYALLYFLARGAGIIVSGWKALTTQGR